MRIHKSYMYKSIEIADILGSLVVVGHDFDDVPMESINSVYSLVRTRDPFIRIQNTHKSLVRIREIALCEDIMIDDSIRLPQNPIISDRLERQYFRLDNETRVLLSEVIKELFEL